MNRRVGGLETDNQVHEAQGTMNRRVGGLEKH